MRTAGILVFTFLFIARAFCGTGLPTAASALNMFISHYSSDEIAWQRDVALEEGTIGEIVRRVAPPRKLGISPSCGVYTFRPVTWAEMSADEKRAVLDDPRLAAWLEWFAMGQKASLAKPIGSKTAPIRIPAGE